MAKKDKTPRLIFLDPSVNEETLAKSDRGEDISGSPLVKGIMSAMNRQDTLKRLTFEEDPNLPHRYGGLFFDKTALIPDRVLKRISIVDDLVATCVTIRSQQITPFGRPLLDKYSTGFRIEPDPTEFKHLSPEDKKDLLDRIKYATKQLITCGDTDDMRHEDAMSLSKYLYVSARSAVVFGRWATEIIYDLDFRTKKKKFKCFRPSDTGTIYRAVPKAHGIDKIRQEALRRLKEIKGWDKEKIDPDKFNNDEYTWVQVIEGTPVEAFTSDEMYVHDCFPTTDIELNGYPLTPIDTAIAAITTHINITTTNKLYFQQGRSARGLIVIESDDVDPGTLADLKQQFVANINDAGKSGRIPVLRIGQGDHVTWQGIESARDMEFQYLYDTNCRVVMAAFQISPDEIPGYAHLSKGTNSQSLSESNNEYKLEAARDVGIRPLLAHFQDFLNNKILPLIDEKVAKLCNIKLYGLDALDPEKEDQRLQIEMELSLTYDDIMRLKEKDPIGKRWGGEYPLNQQILMIHDKFMTVGEQREHFLGIEGAAKDPRWDYVRDAFYFQHEQVIQAQQQMEDQKKIAEEQLQQPQQGAPAKPAEQGGTQQTHPIDQGDAGAPQPQSADPQLEGNIDQLIQLLSKSEIDYKAMKKKWILHHELTVKQAMEDFKKNSETALAESATLAVKNKRD
jgi:hypothetical protein